MRVALIAPPWLPVPPVGYGGTEVVIDGLARGLADRGHDVLLFASGDSTCPVTRDAALPLAIGTDAVSPAAELEHIVHAYRSVLRWEPDIVHDHTLLGPIYGSGHGVPIVTTNHGPFEGGLGDCYAAIAESVPVIAISAHHASTAGSTAVAGMIHHGLDMASFALGVGGEHALFLGRMSPDKGVHSAIRIARAAGVPLKIAAKLCEPDEHHYFDTVVRPLLNGDIEYVGEVSRVDKAELLGGARCLLNPIRWPEPFGLVMVEALACGTPVVATPWGSVPEIIDDGVTGFVKASETELVEAVQNARLLSRTECRRTAEARFSLERMVDDHLDVYRRILDAHSPTTGARPAKMTTTSQDRRVETVQPFRSDRAAAGLVRTPR